MCVHIYMSVFSGDDDGKIVGGAGEAAAGSAVPAALVANAGKALKCFFCSSTEHQVPNILIGI